MFRLNTISYLVFQFLPKVLSWLKLLIAKKNAEATSRGCLQNDIWKFLQLSIIARKSRLKTRNNKCVTGKRIPKLNHFVKEIEDNSQKK